MLMQKCSFFIHEISAPKLRFSDTFKKKSLICILKKMFYCKREIDCFLLLSVPLI